MLKRGTGDAEKAAAADVFYKCWKSAEVNERYHREKLDWKKSKG